MAKKKEKKPKNPIKQVHGAWSTAVDECDWSLGSQVSVLKGFIETSVEDDPSLAEKFKDYLREIVEDETSVGQDDDDEGEEEVFTDDDDDEDSPPQRPPTKGEFRATKTKVTAEVQEALDVGLEICRVIDEDIGDRAKTGKHAEYFESCEDKAKDICKTIQSRNVVTENQRKALDNTLSGLRKWVRDE